MVARRLVSGRIGPLLCAHLAILALAFELAFQLRFDFSVPPDAREVFWKAIVWALPLKLAIFYCFGCFHGWWRYVTFADLAALLRVSVLSTLAIAGTDYFLIERYQIPRAVVLLDLATTILLVGGLRSVWRLQREHVLPMFGANGKHPALLIGADHGGEALVRLIHGSSRLKCQIAGFLDEDRSRYGSRLGGIPFLGHPDDALQLAKKHKSRSILVVAHSISGARLRRLMADCSQAGIPLKVVPPIADLLSGSHRVQVRDVDINDLLRREPVHLNGSSVAKLLKGRCVMVTGAGGSIGSEICRQVARRQADRLILVDRAEIGLFSIDRELRELGVRTSLLPSIADICDGSRMHSLVERHRPQIVFHAAAHKHVPLMESNPGEAIKNNVFGTRGLVEVADQYGVDRFVMISTDKAIHPVGVMGCSKQIAESYVQAFSERSTTKFVVVRFGNVLGSSGSVVSIFREQIRRGGPLTITHPDMRRFFMTIPEATQLVLEAAAMGRGGEVFVLDMGEPVRIMDLAREMIRLSGLSPDDIDIDIVGVRPGEKLVEEVYWGDEDTLPTSHPKLHVARHKAPSLSEVEASIRRLALLVDEPDGVIREELLGLVGGTPSPDALEPARAVVPTRL